VEEGYPKAKIKSGFEIEVSDFGVRYAHTVCGFEVALLLTYLPLCTAEKNHNHAVLLARIFHEDAKQATVTPQ